MTDIKLGVGLHWLESQSYDDVVTLVQEIEILGYEQIWISNEKFFHDMYVVATVVSEQTSGIKIGTFFADPY